MPTKNLCKWALCVFVLICGVSYQVSAKVCQSVFGLKTSLKSESLSHSYSRGLSEVEGFKNLALRLRTQNVDPVKNHIPEFAEQIDSLLQFARTALLAQKSEDLAERWLLLDRFATEATDKKNLRRVTYRWWVFFNLRLSILLTPEDKRSVERSEMEDKFLIQVYNSEAWKSEGRFNRLVNELRLSRSLEAPTIGSIVMEFPRVIMFPTTVGVLGLSALNSRFATDIYVLGLIPDHVWADGVEMYPDFFFGHDFVHSESELFYMRLWEDTLADDLRVFHRRFLKILPSLSPRDRQMVEYVYYLITHEHPYLAKGLVHPDRSGVTEFLFKDSLERMIDNASDDRWYGHLVPKWVNKQSRIDVKVFLLESVQKFHDVINQNIPVANKTRRWRLLQESESSEVFTGPMDTDVRSVYSN